MTNSQLPNLSFFTAILEKVFSRVSPMAAAFQKVSQAPNTIPIWHKEQIPNFIKLVGFYCEDILVSHRMKRIDALAQAFRNLLELDVWARYCNKSEDNAKRFLADMLRDTREMLELERTFFGVDSDKSKRATENLKILGEFAITLEIPGIDKRFTAVRDAAVEIGKTRYATAYKVASKYAHPTAILLTAKEYSQDTMDNFYKAGALSSRSCLSAVENTILKHCPTFEVRLSK